MEHYWVAHPDLVWAPCWLHAPGVPGGDPAVLTTDSGDLIQVPAEQVETLERVSEQQLSGVDDICTLDVVNAGAVIHTVRARFVRQEIYTRVSRILIAVNPFAALPLYSAQYLDDYASITDSMNLPPHIFGIAADALRGLREDSQDQAVLISGESGAGKSESAKLVMSFIADTLRKVDPASVSATAGQQKMADRTNLDERVLRTSPVLEAFGNAMTLRNTNSSRFGKWLDFQFASDLSLCGCTITQYLLETTRICSQTSGERSYHCFFQLLQARDSEELKDLRLEAPHAYKYLKGSELRAPGIDDDAAFVETKEGLAALGFSADLQTQIFRTVASVLALGNCDLVDGAEGAELADDAPVLRAAELLRLEKEDLKRRLLFQRLNVGGSLLEKHLQLREAQAVRDGFSRLLYGLLFRWLVRRINATLQTAESGGSRLRRIGILDLAGFESFEFNSLEQLLINLSNEQLQQHFNNFVFKAELEEYTRECVARHSRFEYADNNDCLLFLEGKGGILDILDECLALPKATDQVFVSKVLGTHGQHPRLVPPKFKHNASEFGVVHYAGTVMYHCDGFLAKNADKQLDDAADLLASSGMDLLKEFGAIVGEHNQATAGNQTQGAKKKNVKSSTSRFRASLRSLIEKIEKATPHFVRCVKPNSAKRSGIFEAKLVSEQLVRGGVVEAVRIRQEGFTLRLPVRGFVNRYRCIFAKLPHHDAQGQALWKDRTDLSEFELAKTRARIMIELLPTVVGNVGCDCVLGATKVFAKRAAQTALENVRSAAILGFIIRIQRFYRGWKARHQLKLAQADVEALERWLVRLGPARGGSIGHDSLLSQLGGIESARQAVEEYERIAHRVAGSASASVKAVFAKAEAANKRLQAQVDVAVQLAALKGSTDPVAIDVALARAKDVGMLGGFGVDELRERASSLRVQLPLLHALQGIVDTVSSGKRADDTVRLCDVVSECANAGLLGSRQDADKEDNGKATVGRATWLPELSHGRKLLEEVLQISADAEAKEAKAAAAAAELKDAAEKAQTSALRRLTHRLSRSFSSSTMPIDKKSSLKKPSKTITASGAEVPRNTLGSDLAIKSLVKKASFQEDDPDPSVGTNVAAPGILAVSDAPRKSSLKRHQHAGAGPRGQGRMRRRPTITGLCAEDQAQLLAKLAQAVDECDAVALERLLGESMRHGINEPELSVANRTLEQLQSEAFLIAAAEQARQAAETSELSPTLLCRLQNLSYQIRVLQGDVETARYNTQASSHGTKRGSRELVQLIGQKRASKGVSFAVAEAVEFDLSGPFRNLDNFSKLKPSISWRGHRASRLWFDMHSSGRANMLGHSKTPVAEALTRVPRAREKAAVQCFRNLLFWMGDKPAQECQRLAGRASILELVRNDVDVRDEIYVQVMKQLRGNTSPRSLVYGWQLLLELCETALPAEELAEFLRMFLLSAAQVVPSVEGEDQSRNNENMCSDKVRHLAEDCLGVVAKHEAANAGAEGRDTDDTDAPNDNVHGLVGVVVHLIDGSFHYVYAPVRSSIAELSRQAGRKLGVRRWRDFGFFHVTDADEGGPPRLLQNGVLVSDLVTRWQQMKKATGHTGQLFWKRRFLRPGEVLLSSDPRHAALTYRQALLEHLRIHVAVGDEDDLLQTIGAAILCAEFDGATSRLRERDFLSWLLPAHCLRDLAARKSKEEAWCEKIVANVKKLRTHLGPQAHQLQRMSRLFALLQCTGGFGAHCWQARQTQAPEHPAVADAPAQALHVAGRGRAASEQELWIFVDVNGVSILVPQDSVSWGLSAKAPALWTFGYHECGGARKGGPRTESKGAAAPGPPEHCSIEMQPLGGDEQHGHGGANAATAGSGCNGTGGRLLQWGARPGILQLVVDMSDGRRSPLLLSLACSHAPDVAFMIHRAQSEDPPQRAQGASARSHSDGSLPKDAPKHGGMGRPTALSAGLVVGHCLTTPYVPEDRPQMLRAATIRA